jgi:hypothetical protein
MHALHERPIPREFSGALFMVYDILQAVRLFPHLTLGEIHSALAYYGDHKEELDEDIERRLESGDKLRATMGESPLVARLKAKGLI